MGEYAELGLWNVLIYQIVHIVDLSSNDYLVCMQTSATASGEASGAETTEEVST